MFLSLKSIARIKKTEIRLSSIYLLKNTFRNRNVYMQRAVVENILILKKERKSYDKRLEKDASRDHCDVKVRCWLLALFIPW